MRKYIVIALVLVTLGVGASFFLLPSATDPAVQGTDTAAAPAIDLTNVDLEAEYAKGRRDLTIVSALADKRAAEAGGGREAAIKLLEEYVAANPNDAQGRKKLALQYGLASRYVEYQAQFEAIIGLEPTEENLQILADLYSAQSDYVKRAGVLKKMLEVTQGAKPNVYSGLAITQLLMGDTAAAEATLNELNEKHPDFNNYEVVRTKAGLHAERGELAEAFSVAQQWTEERATQIASAATTATNPEDPAQAQLYEEVAAAAGKTTAEDSQAAQIYREVADLANLLHFSGSAGNAVALIEPHKDWVGKNSELAQAYVNAMITVGRTDDAYQTMAEVEKSGAMGADLYVPYIKLAISRNDVAGQKSIASNVDPIKFNEWQAINLIEATRAGGAKEALGILLKRFSEPSVLAASPVLASVIGILSNAPDQDATIEKALNSPLQSFQRNLLAQACARAQKNACFDAITKQYPALSAMGSQQISEFSELYITAQRPADALDAFTLEAAKPNANPDIVAAQIRLAAAAGRRDLVSPWLDANSSSVPVARLRDLYYVADTAKQYPVSADIAEDLYARDPVPLSRDILVSAYSKSGNAAKAMPMLREELAKEGSSDALYIGTLTQLARKDAAARKELVDYAKASLQSGKGDNQAQLGYVYILLNNGARDAALPYVKAFASDRGGEWKKMYEQLTMKPGVGGASNMSKLTREQRIAMANNPKISAVNKRGIAFSLMNDGYKDDAALIFQQLAAGKAPDSTEMQELLYVWGGKLDSNQMAWVLAQAGNSSPYDKEKWGDVINNYADDATLIQYVSSSPEALYNASLRKKYFRVLAQTGNKDYFDHSMRNWVAQTTDVDAVSDYAETAQYLGYTDAALNAYKRVEALDPNNAKAINALSGLTMARGNISQAERYVDKSIALSATNPEAAGEQSSSYFYKAMLLKRQGKTAEAQQAYQAVVSSTPTGTTSASALSRLYTAQFQLGQHQEAKSGFEQLLAENPDNKGILADYMSALIEFKYFDDATRIANQYDKTSPYYGRSSSLVGTSQNVSSITRLSNGREMRINFTAPVGDAPMKLADASKGGWIEHSTVGYDSVTISAKPGYVVRFVPTSSEEFAVVPTQTTAVSPQVEARRQEDLRLQLLYAQIEQQTGQPEKAQQRLMALKQYYPNDPQLLSYQASFASAKGDTGDAIALLQQAQSQSPDNEEYARMIQALQSGSNTMAGHATAQNFIKLDGEYRSYGVHDEYISTLSGLTRVGESTEIGMNLMEEEIRPDGILNPSTGVRTSDDASRLAGELFIAHYLTNGDRVQASVFGDENTPGAGLYYGFSNPIGRSEILLEYHKPYWDFPEAVYDYANRDRIGLRHYANLTPTTSMGLETSINSYNIKLDDDQAQSALFRLSLAQQIQPMTDTQPYLGIGYGFDGEYMLEDAKTRTGLAGVYTPFGMNDREGHFLSGIYRDDWTPTTHASLMGGYVFDRLNEIDGPIVEGRLTEDLTDQVEAGVRARYGLISSNGSGDADAVNVGAHLMYKF